MTFFEEIVRHAGSKLGFACSCFSSSFMRRVEQSLSYADWDVRTEDYLGFCLACGLLAGLIVAAFSIVCAFLLPASFLIFALFFFAAVRLPVQAAARRRTALEWEACFGLRRIAAGLDVGLSFEECLRDAAGPTLLGKEFGKILREVRTGCAIHEALQRFALRTDSFFLKKAAAQLAFVYSHGADGEALRKTADEYASVMRMRVKEYNSRLAFHALGFVASAALVPALFMVYATVGGILSAPVSEQAVIAAYVLGFPLLSAALLALVFVRRP